jgi:hypothetical protein
VLARAVDAPTRATMVVRVVNDFMVGLGGLDVGGVAVVVG